MNTRADQIEQARRLIATGISEGLKEVLENQYPELKESEDERISKWLSDILDTANWRNDWPYTKQQVINYLERRKEDNKFAPRVLPCSAAWFEDGEEKHKDSLHISETCKEKCESFTNSEIDKLIERATKNHEIAVEETNKHCAAAIDGCKIERQKEQRPAEIHNPSDAELQRHQDELHNFKVFATKQAKEHHISISFVHDFEWNNFCAELLSYFAEQKPAEWSEEDETAFGDLMWCIEQARKSAKDENDMGNIWFAENWVKNRIKSLRPQPKQEWSEDDERNRDRALFYVRDYQKTNGVTDGSKECVDWLKVLSLNRKKAIEDVVKLCSNEWSEGDNNAILIAIDWLQYYRDTFVATDAAKDEITACTDRLKSLRPSWKPGKEQIYSLGTVVNGYDNCTVGSVGYNLKQLYEQLKKL